MGFNVFMTYESKKKKKKKKKVRSAILGNMGICRNSNHHVAAV